MSSLVSCLLLDMVDLAVAIRKYMKWTRTKKIKTPPMTRDVLNKQIYIKSSIETVDVNDFDLIMMSLSQMQLKRSHIVSKLLVTLFT